MQIIIVDDEMSALNALLVNMVDAVDIKYQIFNQEPLQALEFVRMNKVDAAFLDINMPKINGIELAARLKKLNPNIQIVFISGYEQNEQSIVAQLGDNVVGFFYKPYGNEEMRELLNTLRNSLEKKIVLQTFGSFNVFVNGSAIVISCSKSREMLAYLTDAEGGIVTMGSVINALWPDKNVELAKKLYKDAVFRLRRALRQYGIENLVSFGRAQLKLNVERAKCDLWEYKKRNTGKYIGEYLTNYDWSLERQSQLDLLYAK